MIDNVPWRVPIGLTALLLSTVLGCSSQEGPPRVAVEGQITFHGRPLEKGAILFTPTGEAHGPRAGAVIEEGRYRLPDDRGPVIGELRVEIRAKKEPGYDMTEPTESVQHIGEPLPADDIPPEYNDDSTLFVTTTADGDNKFDFHLPLETSQLTAK